MTIKRKLVCLLASLLMTAPVYALDGASVPKPKQTKLGKYFSAQEAEQFVTQNGKATLFLDVRTPSEVTFLGMPSQADANVPYMLQPDIPVWDESKRNFKLELNPDFIPEVRRRLKAKGLDETSPVVLICRSGDRSAASANLLTEAGFKNVYSVVDGYEGDQAPGGPQEGQRIVNGWKNAGMPWSYKLDNTKMYKIEN